jgi:hypothetical protein
MAITQDRADDSPPEGAGAAPDGEHRVLHDLLGQHPLTGDQQNLPEHRPAVLAIERGHGILVALGDPAQQRGVAGRFGTDRCRAVGRIVHL